MDFFYLKVYNDQFLKLFLTDFPMESSGYWTDDICCWADGHQNDKKKYYASCILDNTWNVHFIETLILLFLIQYIMKIANFLNSTLSYMAANTMLRL